MIANVMQKYLNNPLAAYNIHDQKSKSISPTCTNPDILFELPHP